MRLWGGKGNAPYNSSCRYIKLYDMEKTYFHGVFDLLVFTICLHL